MCIIISITNKYIIHIYIYYSQYKYFIGQEFIKTFYLLFTFVEKNLKNLN